jgi:hypothetical protein
MLHHGDTESTEEEETEKLFATEIIENTEEEEKETS